MPSIIGPVNVQTINCRTSADLTDGNVGTAYAGAKVVTYTGGAGSYLTITVPSTGVLGLTATVPAGTLSGNGTITYTISGIPQSVGTASFEARLGEKSCTFTMNVLEKGQSPTNTPCTPDYSSCFYKTVTLTAGESFVLPAGAEIVSVSDSTKLQSLNNCLDLTNVGGISCYGMAFGAGLLGRYDNNGTALGPGCHGDADLLPFDCGTIIKGIIVSGVKYPFKNSSGAPISFDTSSSVGVIMTCLNSTPFGAIIIGLVRNYRYVYSSGVVTYLAFKTVDDVGLNLIFYGIQQSCATNGPDIVAEYPATSYTNIPASSIGSSLFPACV